MSTFLNALHVVLAVLVIGPLVAAPFAARRAIARRSADGVRFAAKQVALFGGGSIVVAGLGVATLLAGDEWEMTTPWVLVASTLFVVAFGLIWLYAVPALRKASAMVATGVFDYAADGATAPDPEAAAEPDEGTPEEADQPAEQDDAAPPPATPAGSFVTAADLRDKQRLDSISARVAGAGWLLLIAFAAITVLMTVRPFE